MLLTITLIPIQDPKGKSLIKKKPNPLRETTQIFSNLNPLIQLYLNILNLQEPVIFPQSTASLHPKCDHQLPNLSTAIKKTNYCPIKNHSWVENLPSPHTLYNTGTKMLDLKKMTPRFKSVSTPCKKMEFLETILSSNIKNYMAQMIFPAKVVN